MTRDVEPSTSGATVAINKDEDTSRRQFVISKKYFNSDLPRLLRYRWSAEQRSMGQDMCVGASLRLVAKARSGRASPARKSLSILCLSSCTKTEGAFARSKLEENCLPRYSCLARSCGHIVGKEGLVRRLSGQQQTAFGTGAQPPVPQVGSHVHIIKKQVSAKLNVFHSARPKPRAPPSLVLRVSRFGKIYTRKLLHFILQQPLRS